MNLIALAEDTTTTNMSDLLSTLGTVVTQLISWVGDVFTVISEHPIALVGIGIALAFVAVKFTKYILGM